MPRRYLVPPVVAALTFVAGHSALAQSVGYPAKPIRIVTTGVGGNADFVARVLALGLADGLKQQVIVDNRGGGVIPGLTVSQAPADGYTLLVHGATFWMGTLLQKTPYDVTRDFVPISLTTVSPSVLVVHPSMPVKSVKQLIALAKARPGALNYAEGATGSATQIAAELFKSMAGVNMTGIPYKSTGPAIIDAMGGQIQLLFAGATGVTPHIKSGRLSALAVTTAEPSALFPGLPTVSASGLSGYDCASMQGAFAPAKTDAAIVGRINQEIARVLNNAEVKERLLNTGVEAAPSTPEQFATKIKVEMARIAKLIKDGSIKTE